MHIQLFVFRQTHPAYCQACLFGNKAVHFLIGAEILHFAQKLLNPVFLNAFYGFHVSTVVLGKHGLTVVFSYMAH